MLMKRILSMKDSVLFTYVHTISRVFKKRPLNKLATRLSIITVFCRHDIWSIFTM